MAEKVVIDFEANTKAVISAIERVEGRITALGNQHAHAAKKSEDAFKKMKAAANDLRFMLERELIEKGMKGLIRAWETLGRHMDTTTPQMRRFEDAFGRLGDTLAGTMQSALESSGVLDQLTGTMEGVTGGSDEANVAVQNFARMGLQMLVQVTAVAAEGVLGIAAAITAVVDSARIAYNYAQRLGATAGGAYIQMHIDDLNDQIADLEEERADTGSGRRGTQYSRQIATIREEITTYQAALQQFNDMTSTESGETDAAINTLETDMQTLQDAMAGVWQMRGDLVDALAVAPITDSGASDQGQTDSGARHTFTWIGLLAATIGSDADLLQLQLDSVGRTLEQWNDMSEAKDDKGLGGLRSPWGQMTGADRENSGRAGAGAGIRDLVSGAFGNLPSVATGALDQTASAVGQFIAGVDGAFAQLGESIKQTFASTLSGIGQAFTAGAVEAFAAGTIGGGPLAIFGLIGLALSTISGLLGGTGGNGASASRVRAQADVFSAIRGDTQAAGSTIVYHTSIGTYFGDPEREPGAARGVAGGLRRLRRTGAMPRV